jgi:dihydropteroate synthase
MAGRAARVMGIVNVTPDSFHAQSRTEATDAAIARALALADEGASIVDVGGESTRPGAIAVPEAEELARVLPVIEAVAGSVRVSVDTVKPAVARAAVAAGATLLNDVSGAMAGLAAELGVGWVSMHHRGIPAGTPPATVGLGIVGEVADHVLAAARRAVDLGVDEVYVDPGIGFGKDTADNLTLVAHLAILADRAHAEGFGLLVGLSRKRFLGALPHGAPLDADQRFEGSLALAVYAMASGADIVRVHDVLATVRAAVLDAGDEEAA